MFFFSSIFCLSFFKFAHVVLTLGLLYAASIFLLCFWTFFGGEQKNSITAIRSKHRFNFRIVSYLEAGSEWMDIYTATIFKVSVKISKTNRIKYKKPSSTTTKKSCHLYIYIFQLQSPHVCLYLRHEPKYQS